MNDQGYYRYPTIHAQTIVFVCEDDLWSVPADGGVARRLTVSAGECSTPRISPDGTLVAFISRDEGHPEVYVMPAGGGRERRITFHGPEVCLISGWSRDGSEILYASDAGAPFLRDTTGFAVSPRGGTPRRLNLGHALTLAAGVNGRFLIGRNNADAARWKRYRGGTAGDIWVDESGGGTFERLLRLDGNIQWPMWVGERAYFISDHEGIGNLYSCTPRGEDLRQETFEREYYVRFPSTDGTRIVYGAGGQIAILDPQRREVSRVEIATPSTAPQTVRRFVDASQELEHFAPSPGGTSLALIARGQPFAMAHWEEAVTHLGSSNRVRYRGAEWMHDGKRLAILNDGEGREAIALHAADHSELPRIVSEGDIGRVTELATSPVRDVIAFANHRHELLLLDVGDKKARVVDTSPASRIHDLAFSADGRWLAYSWSPAPDTAIIRVVKVKSGSVHDVTPPLRSDWSPAWDPEGKYLYFLSTRDFNPVYDALQFDLSFPQAMRPFVVTLRGDVPSPFSAKPRPIHKDAAEKRDDDEKEKDKGERPVRVEIDFEGIAGRVIGFPVEEADYDQVVATRGRVLFTQFPVRGIKPAGHSWDEPDETGVLMAYDFDQLRSVVMHKDVGEIRLSNDHRTLVYRSHGKLRVVDALEDLPEDGDYPKVSDDPGRKSGWLDLERVRVNLEPRAEWAQMYRESWRMQREQFWNEQMSAVDWDLVGDRYERLLPRVRTRGELSDLIWEMQGELGTSHAYEFGGDHREPPHYARGFLGADLQWDQKHGGYRIERILRGDSWDRDHDSPLAEPGVDVHQGDLITAIGGVDLSAERTPEEVLVNTADQHVVLTISPRKGGQRRVTVKALRDERMLRYRAWVEANRTHVHEQTGGRVGYLHIPDMGPFGFSEFHRGYLTEFNRDGLIVDVRFNRGGHVSPLLLEKLARKRVGYDVSRYGPPTPYPPESVGGPIVALTNQFAGSDGDIFSHCFKLYKLGPLVGKRTWGGVIGINPYHRLVDGTITTQPEFSFWFVDVGWKVENYGTDPDCDVDVAPQDVREGRDPQMREALRLMNEALIGKNGLPSFVDRPRLTLPFVSA